MNTDKTVSQKKLISRLQRLMLALSTLYFSHPKTKGGEDLLTQCDDILNEANTVVAALDEDWISTTVGDKQGQEFSRLQLLRSKEFGPTQAELVAKLSFRGKRDREDDEDETRTKNRNTRTKNKKADRIPPKEWATMTPEARKTHIEQRKLKRK